MQATFPQEAATKPAHGVLGDEEVLRRARACKKTGSAFRGLYDQAQTDGYASRSEAHYDLCRMLAFWTDADEGQIERLFWRSSLAATVERPKPRAYIQRTIRRANERQTRHYAPGMDEAGQEAVLEVALEHFRRAGRMSWDSELDRLVYLSMVRRAGEYGYLLESGEVRFNANQQEIAAENGTHQRAVSRSLKRLLEGGLLRRASKGHPGRNSYYLLSPCAPADLPAAPLSTMQRGVDTRVYYVTPQGGGSRAHTRDAHAREEEQRTEHREELTEQTKTASVSATEASAGKPAGAGKTVRDSEEATPDAERARARDAEGCYDDLSVEEQVEELVREGMARGMAQMEVGTASVFGLFCEDSRRCRRSAEERRLG